LPPLLLLVSKAARLRAELAVVAAGDTNSDEAPLPPHVLQSEPYIQYCKLLRERNARGELYNFTSGLLLAWLALSALLIWKYPVIMPFLDTLVKTERVLSAAVSRRIFAGGLWLVALYLLGVLYHDLRALVLLTFRLGDLDKEVSALVKKSASRLSGSEA
jgi:hypothetical protein